MSQSRFLSVVVPCFNEERTIKDIIGQVFENELVSEVIIIDDGSTDQTWSILANLTPPFDIDLKRLRLEKNSGKGAAIALGFSEVSCEILIIQDADLEYSPSDYLKIVAPIIQGNADVVYGSRFLSGEARRVLYFWHYLGNKFLTLISNMTTNLNLSDMETGYKAMRRVFAQDLNLREKKFGVEPEITAKLAQLGARFYEVSISYRGRTYAEGKKIGWRDGIQAIICIIRYGVFTKQKRKVNDET
jgi:glycosyltransferase involved in cell wall biosynthesis